VTCCNDDGQKPWPDSRESQVAQEGYSDDL
jgi:hypothetical protein